ncbi:MAG: hypothetical protein IPF93_13415 [Saprospiraceae bacterium]|nr:hypothetical protein [Saprospiraceae bacterium]
MVVEHDKEIMLASDYLIGPGSRGGHPRRRDSRSGHPEGFMDKQSMTADF